MNGFLTWIDGVATRRALAILTVLEAGVLAAENLLDYPLSVPYMRRLTGHPYLDMCAFCSASEVRTQLDDFGERGRALQLLLMPTIDVVIPVLSFAFGSVALAILLREARARWARGVRMLPLAAMVLDFAENATIVMLVRAYPTPLPAVAGAMGVLTGLKFLAYGASLAAILALTGARLVGRREASSRSLS
jgi:hypothetical protein